MIINNYTYTKYIKKKWTKKNESFWKLYKGVVVHGQNSDLEKSLIKNLYC